MTSSTETLNRYQILQPAGLPAEQSTRLAGVIYIGGQAGPGLIFVTPEQIPALTAMLHQVGLRTVVIPDFVFVLLVAQCKQLGFEILDVEFALPSADLSFIYKPSVAHLIKSNDYLTLYNFLQHAKPPITAMQIQKNGLRVKLYGSGLIIIEGDAEDVRSRVKEFFQQLTEFLIRQLPAG